MKRLHFHGIMKLPDGFQIDAGDATCFDRAFILAGEHLKRKLEAGEVVNLQGPNVRPGDTEAVREKFETLGRDLYIAMNLEWD